MRCTSILECLHGAGDRPEASLPKYAARIGDRVWTGGHPVCRFGHRWLLGIWQ